MLCLCCSNKGSIIHIPNRKPVVFYCGSSCRPLSLTAATSAFNSCCCSWSIVERLQRTQLRQKALWKRCGGPENITERRCWFLLCCVFIHELTRSQRAGTFINTSAMNVRSLTEKKRQNSRTTGLQRKTVQAKRSYSEYTKNPFSNRSCSTDNDFMKTTARLILMISKLMVRTTKVTTG